jgi:hypothetical protein
MSEGLGIACNTPTVDRYTQEMVNRIPEALREKYLSVMERLGRAATLLSIASTVAHDTGYGEDYGIASDEYNAAIAERIEFGR